MAEKQRTALMEHGELTLDATEAKVYVRDYLQRQISLVAMSERLTEEGAVEMTPYSSGRFYQRQSLLRPIGLVEEPDQQLLRWPVQPEPTEGLPEPLGAIQHVWEVKDPDILHEKRLRAVRGIIRRTSDDFNPFAIRLELVDVPEDIDRLPSDEIQQLASGMRDRENKMGAINYLVSKMVQRDPAFATASHHLANA
jgi:hypothetical protein